MILKWTNGLSQKPASASGKPAHPRNTRIYMILSLNCIHSISSKEIVHHLPSYIYPLSRATHSPKGNKDVLFPLRFHFCSSVPHTTGGKWQTTSHANYIYIYMTTPKAPTPWGGGRSLCPTEYPVIFWSIGLSLASRGCLGEIMEG